MLQLILHLVGDYLTQSHWMASNKNKHTWPCLCHCFLYTLPFLILTSSAKALAIIFASHLFIDRFGLARYLVWIKNWMSPDGFAPWKRCMITGYVDAGIDPPDKWSLQMRPTWLSVWLFIIADNTLHLICNALALHYYTK